MKLYLAMWVRGPLKDKTTIEEMNKNKQRAVIYAEQLEKYLGKNYSLVLPHTDKILTQIDEAWAKDKSPHWVGEAMSRCYTLLESCDGIILITLGTLTEGMSNEKEHAKNKGMFVYQMEHLTKQNVQHLKQCLEEYEGFQRNGMQVPMTTVSKQ